VVVVVVAAAPGCLQVAVVLTPLTTPQEEAIRLTTRQVATPLTIPQAATHHLTTHQAVETPTTLQ
jgi:hypothetical protein